MQKLFLFGFLLCSSMSLFAQVTATTDNGIKVILHENGTWEYYQKKISFSDTNQANTSQPTVAPQTVASSVSSNHTTSIPASTLTPATPISETQETTTFHSSKEISINSNREATSSAAQLFNATSERLAKFFGKEKGKITCSATAKNNKGNVELTLEWQAQVGDGYRYFGHIEEGSTLHLSLSNGTKIDLTYGPNPEEKFLDDYDLTVYRGTCPLTKEQVDLLIKNTVIELTVDWKKKSETYKLDDIDDIRSILIDVI